MFNALGKLFDEDSSLPKEFVIQRFPKGVTQRDVYLSFWGGKAAKRIERIG